MRIGRHACCLTTALALAFAAAPAAAGEATPQCAGPTCSGACAAVDASDQQQLRDLVERQRDELVSLTRTLAAEQKRQAELESELSAARQPVPVAAAAAPDTGNEVVEENRRLRALLELEREQNDRLTAKLQTASRVADLVFRSSDEALEPADLDEEPRAAAAVLPADADAAVDDGTAWHFPAGGE